MAKYSKCPMCGSTSVLICDRKVQCNKCYHILKEDPEMPKRRPANVDEFNWRRR